MSDESTDEISINETEEVTPVRKRKGPLLKRTNANVCEMYEKWESEREKKGVNKSKKDIKIKKDTKDIKIKKDTKDIKNEEG